MIFSNLHKSSLLQVSMEGFQTFWTLLSLNHTTLMPYQFKGKMFSYRIMNLLVTIKLGHVYFAT